MANEFKTLDQILKEQGARSPVLAGEEGQLLLKQQLAPVLRARRRRLRRARPALFRAGLSRSALGATRLFGQEREAEQEAVERAGTTAALTRIQRQFTLQDFQRRAALSLSNLRARTAAQKELLTFRQGLIPQQQGFGFKDLLPIAAQVGTQALLRRLPPTRFEQRFLDIAARR